VGELAGVVEGVDGGASAAQSFTISCAPEVESLACIWQCAGDPAACTGTCTATARGGKQPYRVAWSLAGTEQPASKEPSQGPWSETFTCAPGAVISFKVRNAFGAPEWSAPSEAKCGEGAAAP